MPVEQKKAGKRPYLYLIEGYRGIAATAVVLHHIGAIAEKQYQIEFLNGIFNACHLRLDFFFVLSGFIIGWLHHHEFGQAKNAPAFLRKRLMRIYPLLFILTTVKLAFILITMGGRWSKDHLDLSLILSSYLMLPSDRFPLILAAWTMPFEVLFYVFFAIGLIIGRKWLACLTVIWCGCIILGNVLPLNITGIWPTFLLKPFHLQLLAGMGTSILVQKFGRTIWGKPLMIAGFAMLAGGLVMHVKIAALPALYERCWWGFVFCALIAGTALYETGRRTPVPVPRWLKALGRSSYSIYLIHSPLIVVLLAVFARYDVLHRPGNDFILAFIGIVSVAAGLLCYRFVEAPLNSGLKKRTAQRTKTVEA